MHAKLAPMVLSALMLTAAACGSLTSPSLGPAPGEPVVSRPDAGAEAAPRPRTDAAPSPPSDRALIEPVPEQGHAVDSSHLHGLISYDYQVWVPGSYRAGTPAPLVLALHGCGQLKGDLAKLSRLDEEADRRGFLVLYPQQSPLMNPGSCWNTSYAYNEQRDSGELAVVMGILGEVRKQYSVDASRIYVTGLSSGAAMTSNLAACYMDVFAAAAVVAGPMYQGAVLGTDAMAIVTAGSIYDPVQRGLDAWSCSNKPSLLIPVMDVQGSADVMVAAKNGEQVIQQFAVTNDWADDGKANGSITATPTTTVSATVPGGYPYTIKTTAVAGKPLLRSIQIEGMSHAWSGGNPSASTMGFGGDAKGPVITPMIWDFFSQHHR